jgi:hypothetical protein
MLRALSGLAEALEEAHNFLTAAASGVSWGVGLEAVCMSLWS